jgi:hypothetical protein
MSGRISADRSPRRGLARNRNRRASFESLESRKLLAAVHWDGGGNGADWSDPNNWNTNQVPGPADDVTIDVSGTPTVYVRNGTVASVRSIHSREAMIVEGSGTRLEVSASSYTSELLILRGNAELRTAGLFSVYGTLAELVLSWGTVSGGGTLAVGEGATLDITTTLNLNNVNLLNNGTADWSNGDIRLNNAGCGTTKR